MTWRILQVEAVAAGRGGGEGGIRPRQHFPGGRHFERRKYGILKIGRF